MRITNENDGLIRPCLFDKTVSYQKRKGKTKTGRLGKPCSFFFFFSVPTKIANWMKCTDENTNLTKLSETGEKRQRVPIEHVVSDMCIGIICVQVLVFIVVSDHVGSSHGSIKISQLTAVRTTQHTATRQTVRVLVQQHTAVHSSRGHPVKRHQASQYDTVQQQPRHSRGFEWSIAIV